MVVELSGFWRGRARAEEGDEGGRGRARKGGREQMGGNADLGTTSDIPRKREPLLRIAKFTLLSRQRHACSRGTLASSPLYHHYSSI
jgi:hypothetical protein